MYIHFICISSSYSTGKRIALDRCFENEINSEVISAMLNRISMSRPDGAPVATHTIQTKDSTWESVIEADVFFKDIEVIESVDRFIQLIARDEEIVANDVARYIISKVKCTHLKLQKLLYFCYADFLVKHNRKLFDDTIYAFRYGPVVRSTYESLKGVGIQPIADVKDTCIKKTPTMRLPARSRIIFSNHGIEKIVSIDSTLERYGSLSAEELVKLTHAKGSPWNISCVTGNYDIIKDVDIIQYHKAEELNK